MIEIKQRNYYRSLGSDILWDNNFLIIFTSYRRVVVINLGDPMAEAGELVHNVRLVYRHLVPREPPAWERLVLAVVGESARDVCEGVLIVKLKIKVENESRAFVYR